MMKKRILIFATVFMTSLGSFAQFTFVHISDMHVSSVPTQNSDTNAQYFRCAIKEFAAFHPKPAFVIATGDIADVGNEQPDGMYPVITQYLFPRSLINPAAGAYCIDSARAIPIYFTPGNHEYWTGFDSINIPISNPTLFYYPEYITPDADFAVTNDLAVIVCMRSGHDSPYGNPPNPDSIKGTGFSDEQISWLRNILITNSSKRKIIVMHHPAVNAAGTNSDGTPITFLVADTTQNSLLNNRTRFLDICDSNHVDVVLNGHEHQNVVANRKGDTIGENWPNGTRYVQTAAAFNRSYRVITVDPGFVTVGRPMRSVTGTGVGEVKNPISFYLFPNPAHDKITIECPQKSRIEILNISGQILKLFTAADLQSSVDLSSLPGGVYMIRVTTEKGTMVKKFIKQ